MTVVCAWCGQVIAVGGEMVSHGICPGCSRRVEAALMTRLGLSLRRRAPRRRRILPPAGAPLPGFALELRPLKET